MLPDEAMVAQFIPVIATLASTVIVALIGALGIWIKGWWDNRAANRVASGTVETSDAATVFANQIAVLDASEKLRHDAMAQLERCAAETESLKAAITKVEERMEEQAIENRALLRESRKRIATLEGQLMEMTRLLAEKGPDDTGT
jgi:hypothetical protein